MPDHVHMLISIPPKYAVSQVMGYMKGKSAIHLARVYGEKTGSTSATKKRKIDDWSSCSFGDSWPPITWPLKPGPR